MAILDNLEAHWRLDEASGIRVDSHGANDLTDNNTVGQGTGKIGNAADFELNNSEYLSIADNTSLSMGNIDFTITVWVNLESDAADMGILGKDGEEYALIFSNILERFIFEADAENVAADTLGIPSLATWYFIVGFHDATANTINIQVNDGTVDSAAHTTGAPDLTNAFNIGGTGGAGDNPFDGLIDSVSVWKRVLTAQERTDLYNGGAGLDYPFAAGTPVSNSVLVPYEVLAGLAESPVIFHEAMAGFSAAAASPYEGIFGLARSAVVPMEAKNGLAQPVSVPMESLEGVNQPGNVAFESLKAADSSAPRS